MEQNAVQVEKKPAGPEAYLLRCKSRGDVAAATWLLYGGVKKDVARQHHLPDSWVRERINQIVRERRLGYTPTASEEGIAAFAPLRDKAESIMTTILEKIDQGECKDSTLGGLVLALGSFTKAMEGSADRLQDTLRHDGPIAYPTSFYKAQVLMRYLATVQEITPEKAEALGELVVKYYNEAKNEKRGKYRVWIRKMQLPPDAELPKPFEGGVKMPEPQARVQVSGTALS